MTARLAAATLALVAAVVAGPAKSREGASVPLEKLVGQHFVVRMAGTRPSSGLLRRVRAGQVGGVIVFSDNAPSVGALRALLARLNAVARAGANPPLVALVDQEGGTVKRLSWGPPSLSARGLGGLGDARRAFSEGRATGRFLRRAGIAVDLAPVLDVPTSRSFLRGRAYSSNRFNVASVGVAFARGLRTGGAAATAKHFPGLGTARRSTDERPVTISRSRRELERRMLPFRVAVHSGVELVMVSNAAYPAYGPSRTPAVFSPAIVRGLLRKRLGFGGLVVTDDLEARAVRHVSGRAAAALRAGADLVLFARSASAGASAYAETLAAARAGKLDRAELERSYQAIVAFKSERAK